MSRYLQLQQLLKQEDNTIDKLSFYPDHLLNLRTILSDWVEAQDWSGVLSLGEESLANYSKELLQEALKLLQDKLESSNSGTTGFDFHIRNTETKLKKAYQKQPKKFVEELSHCLIEEEEVLNNMMSQEQAMCMESAPSCQQMSFEELSSRIANCRKLDERIISVLKAAFLCLEKWKPDIQSKSEELRDVYGNGKTILPPYHVFQRLRQELEQKSHAVIGELNTTLNGVRWAMSQWKTWQLHECVSRKVDGEHGEIMSPQVEQMCEQVCVSMGNLMRCATSKELQCVDSVQLQSQSSPASPTIPTPSIISWFCIALKDILRRIVEMLLVVREQPPLTMMIEKEKGQKDKEDINNSKKFKTTVGILGGKGFADYIAITEVEIYLAFNHDLAEAQPLNRQPEKIFKIYHDRPDSRGRYSSRHSSGSLDSPTLPYEKTYEKLRVEHFSRKETKHVYKQLYHVVYDVKLHFPLFMQEFNAQAISLPIIVRTGANQASEHIGAQLWHSFSSSNMYNLRGEIASSMKVSEVIQMMNERIKSIGGDGLRDHEKEFLKERLFMAANTKEAKYSDDVTVTLDNFIKDKVQLPRYGSTPGAKDLMDFSLWRWLHSIINLLDDPQYLKRPWTDGIIYGFASRMQCISALEGAQDGTFLLRFSESFLPGNHIMAKGGLAAVIQRNRQPDFAPPITSEDIEREGLAAMIANIGCQYLLGTKLTINDLIQRYPPSNPLENPTISRYYGWRKQEIIVPSNSMYSGTSQVSSADPDGASAPKRERKKPRRPVQKTRAKENPSLKHGAPPGSPESTTSSVPSPMAIAPDGQQQFQAVGVREFKPQVNTSNIPTTVLTQMIGTNGIDQEMMSDTSNPAYPQTMVLHLPESQAILVGNGLDTLDISEPSGFLTHMVCSATSFAQNTTTPSLAPANFMTRTDDPNLQGVLSGAVLLHTNDVQALTIEEVEECLLVDTDSLSLSQPQNS